MNEIPKTKKNPTLTFALLIKVILLLVLASGCNSNTESNTSDTSRFSFTLGSVNTSEKLMVCYTNDPDSLWMDVSWINGVHKKMIKLSEKYSSILIFDGQANTPDVSIVGANYAEKYDKHLVCGYWTYPTGKISFCYGGIDDEGNFRKCK